jgi:rfaE bifunctional protein kinase chain/domain
MANMDFDRLFESFPSIKIGVIGDLMLDTYWWGHVERISPEAPVPIVTLDKKEYRIGGAGNVALNLASLGSQVTVFSVIGQDDDGQVLTALIEKEHIDTRYLLKSAARITTNKARIISKNQQMLRLDAETTKDLSAADENRMLQHLQTFIEQEKPRVIIFEDYNKGVLTSRVIEAAIALCRDNKVLTAVDPKRKHFFSYIGADIFKPNLAEVKEGLNLLLEQVNLPVLEDIHAKLAEKLHHRISFITLSEKGVFFQYDQEARIIPSHVRNIADVSGAGDTVIAVASLLYAATQDVKLMAQVANVAGGLVCEEVGTVAIDKARLLKECKLLLS